jgi:integrase
MPLDMGEVNAPRKIYNGQRKVASKQIKVMLQKAGTEFYERNRGIIMMAKDTGLRMSDLSMMDLEHYASSQLVETDVGPFRVFKPIRTKKTGDLAHIRIGPEAIEAIETWLKIRRHNPGPMFTKRGGGRLSRKGASALFLRKSHHLEDGYKISGHSFRKFHKTSLEGAGMNENWIRRLQGKAHDVYSAPSEEELTEAYMSAYDRLRILGEPAAYTAKELETLKSDNALLQDRIERLEQRIDQGYGSPRALIEMLRKEGLVTAFESKSQDKSKTSLPHRRPLER